MLLERSLSGTANQHLCCQIPGNKLLDSHHTPKERTPSGPVCHPMTESEDIPEQKQMTFDEIVFPRYPD